MVFLVWLEFLLDVGCIILNGEFEDEFSFFNLCFVEVIKLLVFVGFEFIYSFVL